MVKVVIATPCYGGMLHASMADARAVEQCLLLQTGHGVILDTSARTCWLPRSRNRLAQAALQRDATDLLFWDSDVVPLEAGYVARLLALPFDIVGGAYPTKSDDGALAWQVVDGHVGEAEMRVRMEHGCFEVARIGTGFLRIRTSALIAMEPHVMQYANGERGWFDYAERDGEPLQDDYAFCDRARRAGLRVMADPSMRFAHIGQRTYLPRDT